MMRCEDEKRFEAIYKKVSNLSGEAAKAEFVRNESGITYKYRVIERAFLVYLYAIKGDQ